MPQLGESVTEGTLAKWLVRPGERLSKYQPIAEVITDKVNAEIPAPEEGEMAELLIPEGETVKVGTPIARMRLAGAAVGGGPRPVPIQGAAAMTLDRAEGRFSPAVLRLAQEHGVDLRSLTGSGLGGRITRKDVEGFVARSRGAGGVTAGGVGAEAGVATVQPVAGPVPAVPAPATAQPALPPAPALAGGGDQLIPVDPVRRRIAEKMVQSKHEAPHAWTMLPVDVTGLVKLKETMGEEFHRREGISLSYVPFFIKAVVESLKEFPIINSQWADDQIIIRQEINISVAVATETALAVPVIRQADRLSIVGLNHAVADLAARARAGKLTVDDISGGTFTVNNTGYFGSVQSSPIINHPQAAILAFERITKMPVVLENDAIAIRSMINLCMSMDHRVLDGLVCGRFLQAVGRRLQAYAPGTINLY